MDTPNNAPPSLPYGSPDKDRQSAAEEIANSLTHGIGVALGIVALVLLVVYAGIHGDAWRVVGLSVFGTTLILLYLASTLYHAIRHPRLRRFFRILDHSAIFLLIAGTYTPITLSLMRGGWGWTIFGLIWGLAILGIVTKILIRADLRGLSVAYYIGMGWLVLVALKPTIRMLPTGLLVWLLIGGVSYSLGVVFFAMRNLRFHHTIWHLFVLGGSISHFFGMLFYVVA